MIEKSSCDSKNGNAYVKKSRVGSNVTKYMIMSLAVIALVAILASAGNAIFKSATLDASNTSLDSIIACEENALKYEQLGYYSGGVHNLTQSLLRAQVAETRRMVSAKRPKSSRKVMLV